MDRTGNDRTMTALITTAAVLAWSGIHSLASFFGIAVVGPEMYLITQCISAVVLVWAAWSAVAAGDMHRGMVPMMFGLSVLTGIYSVVIGDHASASALRMSFVLPLAISAVMMWMDGMKIHGAGTMALALAVLSLSLTGDVADASTGPLLMASGAMLACSAFRHEEGPSYDPARACRALCLMLIAVHASMVLLSKGLLMGEYIGLSVSVAIAIVSISLFERGMVVSGCCGILYSMTGMLAGIPIFDETGAEAAVMPVIAVVCIIVGSLAFYGKEKAIGLGTAVFGAALGAFAATDSAACIAFGSAILALLCLAEAVRTWKSNEQYGNGPDALGRIAAVSSAGMLVLAVAVLSNAAVEIAGVDRGSLDHVTLAGSAFMMGFTIVAMRGRMISEAMVFLMAGCYLFVYPLSKVLEDPNEMMPVGVTLCIGFAVAAYTFWRLGYRVRSTGCLLLVASLLLPGLGATGAVPIIPMAGAGIAFLLVSMKKMVRFGVTSDAKIEERVNLTQSENQYATVLVMSLCTIVLMMLAFIGELSDLLPKGNFSLAIFRLMLLCTILGFGLYSVRRGFTVLGIYLLGSFLLCMLMASFATVGIEMPMALNVLSSVLFLPVIAAFHLAGNRLMTIVSTLMILAVVVEPLMRSTWEFDLIVLVFKTVSGIIGVTLWIEYDAGRVIVPHYSRLWRKDLIAEGPTRIVPPCILHSAFMLAAVAMLWAAAGPLVPEQDLAAFHISVALAAAMCIAVSTGLFHTGSPDWGAFFMLLSIGIAAHSIAWVLSDNAGTSAYVCLPMAVLALTAFFRRSWALTSMCAAAIVAFVLMCIAPSAGCIIMACLGLASAAVSTRGMIKGDSWASPSGLGLGWTVSMVGAVGLCICLIGSDSMLMASILASAFIMTSAFGCGSHGMRAECLALLSASIPGLAVCASSFWGADMSTVPLVIPAALMAASALMFRNDGRRPESALCTVGCALVAASTVTGSWALATVGCLMGCLSVVLSGICKERASEPVKSTAGD